MIEICPSISSTRRLRRALGATTIIAVDGNDHRLGIAKKMGADVTLNFRNVDVIDEVIQVSYEEAKKVSRALAEKEGIFVGISSGAAIHASIPIAEKLGKGKRVVTILPSTGERYLSTGLFDPM